jgi:hypothetical protein
MSIIEKSIEVNVPGGSNGARNHLYEVAVLYSPEY